MLTQKRLKEVLHYNPDTGIFTWKIKTARCVKIGSIAGSVVSNNYIHLAINYRDYKAHRLAWLYIHGVWPENEIDHIDHNPKNNKLINLRSVTTKENSKNRKKYCTNTSGVNGVHWCKRRSKWISRARDNGNNLFSKGFKDFFEAVCHRKSLEIKHNFHANHGR